MRPRSSRRAAGRQWPRGSCRVVSGLCRSWLQTLPDPAFQRGQLGLVGGIGCLRFALLALLVEGQIALAGLGFHLRMADRAGIRQQGKTVGRSEEHTSELHSLMRK